MKYFLILLLKKVKYYFSSFVTRHSSFILSLFHVKPSDPWNLIPNPYFLRIIIFYFKLRIYKYTLLKPTLLQTFLSVIFKKWYT